MYFESMRPAIGSIEVICGSMFSGKTEELIRRINRVRFAKLKMMVFKPSMDIRYSEREVVSHNRTAAKATPVESSAQILDSVTDDVQVVAIDEAQFFDDELPRVVEALALRRKRVICAGLDMDYLGKPFGPMPQLMAIADDVYKTRAICVRCGQLANFSFRKGDCQDQVLLGEKGEYMPLCRACFAELMQSRTSQQG